MTKLNSVVDLLLISWNRREYLEKTLANLLSMHSDFRLYCWDNASHDGTADIIAGITDPRIIKKYFSKENVIQRLPCLWFINQAKNELVGKIDDDILLPHGWIETIGQIILSNKQFGLLGCWCGMPDDWNEHLAQHKIISFKNVSIFQNLWIQGHSFLIRHEYFNKYFKTGNNYTYGLPIDQLRMNSNGLINGWPLPLLLAHNMDDPRSDHCLIKEEKGLNDQAALTARWRGFSSLRDYENWIRRDFELILKESFEEQLRRTGILPEKKPFSASVKLKIKEILKYSLIKFMKNCMCNVCGWQGKHFIKKEDYLATFCPYCRSQNFERAIAAKLQQMTEVNWSIFIKKSQILRFGPKESFSEILIKSTKNYLDATLFNEAVNLSLDVSKVSLMRDKSFDLIVAADYLEHLCDIEKGINEMYRLLRPNGKIIVTVWQEIKIDGAFNKNNSQKKTEIEHSFKKSKHIRPLDGDLTYKLKNAGFIVKEIDILSLEDDLVKKYDLLFHSSDKAHNLIKRRIYYGERK
ncbi:methyltransferase domain-containing protein [Thermodesulfobacteriota bacterium]